MEGPVEDEIEEGIDCSPCCEPDKCKKTFVSILLGQVLSLCLCGTSVSSQYLSNFGVNTPIFQNFANYFFLCFVYGTLLSCQSGDKNLLVVFRKRGWKYFLIAFLDVQANFLFVYAYQFTTLTSIQMLDCFVIPTVLVLSWLFLSTRYLLSHILGVFICLLGASCLIWTDTFQSPTSSGSGQNRLIGDLLCLAGSVLYGISNTSEEYLVKHYSRIEYLGMVGLFGAFISGMQLAVFERSSMARVQWSTAVVCMYLLYALSMFAFYSFVAVFVRRTSAVMFNLSILTVDFYVLLFGLFLFKYKFHFLYFVSFGAILCGTVLYTVRETKKREDSLSCYNCFSLIMHCFSELFQECNCCCNDRSASAGSDSNPQVDQRLAAISNLERQTHGEIVKFCPIHGPISDKKETKMNQRAHLKEEKF